MKVKRDGSDKGKAKVMGLLQTAHTKLRRRLKCNGPTVKSLRRVWMVKNPFGPLTNILDSNPSTFEMQPSAIQHTSVLVQTGPPDSDGPMGGLLESSMTPAREEVVNLLLVIP